MSEIRKMTGICPQHDILFDELTPKEHLEYFASIRGMAPDRIDDEVKKILSDIDLKEKTDVAVHKLSGGQKRKLSVGIALIGDPKIIFLDEPTAGVDPYSRRHMWKVLKERKAGKIILLTTHFMDEADILADRKAIVSKGKLRCYGSSMFLKNRFGAGYYLTMIVKRDCKLSKIRRDIRKFIPNAVQDRLYGREVSFLLPRSGIREFPDLFSEIERKIRDDEDVMNYGVSMTTLEEVFLKLGNEEEVEEDKADYGSTTSCPIRSLEVKEMDGFSFQSFEIKKSSWRIFLSLFKVFILSVFSIFPTFFSIVYFYFFFRFERK